MVIIDEIDCIVKQAKNEKDLDIDTPKQVWEIFDVCSHFPNMILIGITNDVTGMPAPLQTRFAGDTIEVPQLDSAAAHKQIILFHLKETLWSMSDNELDSLAKKTKKFSTREVEKLAITACSLAYLRNSIAHCVTYGDCQKAYAQIEKSRSLLKKWSWSDYEKPLQYGLQIAGLVVNIVSLISNWRMSYLSHTLAKEAHELAKISFAHNVEATKASQAMGEKQMAQLGDQFKESMALSKESFEHSKETAEISQLQVERGYQQAETLHADNKNFQRSLSVQSILVSNEQFKESMDLSKLSLLHGIESTQLQLKQSFYQHEENKALQLALALEGKQHSVDLQNISNGYAQRAQDRAGYEALSNFLNSRRELTPQERREQNLRNGTYGYK